MNVRDRVLVIPIPPFLFRVLRWLPGWHETHLPRAKSIAVHSHRYMAMYFVQHIADLQLRSYRRSLPRCAVAIFSAGTPHGWIQSQVNDAGRVGHFHSNHEPHALSV
jgi:hypothetical protein